MPKELRPTTCRRASQGGIGSVQQSPTGLVQNAPRNTAIWSGADDQTLISARASGLNWQPIAARHFPNKTANACRKRHERLMERRHHDEWDSRKLNALAIEYMECRKEMWNVLAVRIGERWGVVEAKCMEKGLKNLQTIARAAQKKAGASESAKMRGNEEYEEGDSGIGVSDEDAEMEVGIGKLATGPASGTRPLRPLQPLQLQRVPSPNTYTEPQILPPLPLYQPPPSAISLGRVPSRASTKHGMSAFAPQREQHSRSPESSGQRGVSIQSMLSQAP